MNSDAKALTYIVVHDHDESLEIKEGIIKVQETAGDKYKETFKSTFCTVYIEENDNLTAKEKFGIQEMKQIQESTQETKKKHKCEKCALSYTMRSNLYRHQKFECGVTPQFSCKFCSKPFKRKYDLKTHVDRMHLNSNLKKTILRHNCDQCSRSYTKLEALSRHKRSVHAAVKPQFFCDVCGFKMNRKSNLAAHIANRHFK
ncbi:GDNF-inducible zinc finger protein 1-like [Belonocnema kinseyi]|uniref:GDNF-inducible zinc finger protein 1-like n=1 Tax=Belonocnema kinseyi TaxID=2817044 RepID=UPI00143D7AA9|nr:GDNF-inducible zinc finger protein 1-like [Belonocnema kinseyi]